MSICILYLYAETGGIAIAPRPSAPNADVRSGMPMRPFPGQVPALCDEKVHDAHIVLYVAQSYHLCELVYNGYVLL